MNRREFSSQSLCAIGALGVAAGLPLSARAQGGPIEGTNYLKLAQAAPTSAPAGKVEVLEFFWYGCPHCYHFEPDLAAWAAKLPPDVAFRRVPVALRPNPGEIHQRLFYALEGMGLLPTLHAKVFRALHEERLTLDKPELIGDFVAKQGVDKAKFLAMLDSFAVQTKARQARTLIDAYRLDGVPAIGVGGVYYTSISLNGSAAATLATTDALIQKLRKR